MNNNDTKKESVKTIIITRSTAYSPSKESQNQSEEFKKKFFKAIEGRKDCLYNRKDKLKSFLKAKSLWEEKRINYNSDGDAYEMIIGEKAYGDDVERIPELVIEHLMDQVEVTDLVYPYACFPNGDNEEVILVLYDLIGIETNEPIDTFELFVKSICEDVGLKKNDGVKASLFVHDKQIRRFGDCDSLDIMSFVSDESLIEVFDHFCCFEHSPQLTSIFQNIILKKGCLN